MSAFDGIEFFTVTVSAGSFAAAARKLRVTPSAVSRRVAALEGELGVQLLARTTRTLRLTEDGLAFHERCVRILEELHEARDAIARARLKPSGLLRVDAPIALGRTVLAPRLPAFLERYPEIQLDLTLRDQLVDPVAEGLDVLVRIGPLRDSPLIARKLGESRGVLCASPSYLRKHGKPKQLSDLAHHQCLGYLREGRPSPFDFAGQGGAITTVAVAGRFNANDADLLLQLALAGRGVAWLFDFIVESHVARGELLPLLPEHTTPVWPVHALYPQNRHLLPKVRAFVDFLAGTCGLSGGKEVRERPRRPARRRAGC
jgi:DNA-binding transcriptional LysR family regulator